MNGGMVTTFHQKVMFYAASDVIFYIACQAVPRKPVEALLAFGVIDEELL